MNTKSLNNAIENTGKRISVDESKPNEMCNEGTIELWLDDDYGEQFVSSGGLSMVQSYYSDIKGSRSDAIRELVSRIGEGFEDMSEETAYACGCNL